MVFKLQGFQTSKNITYKTKTPTHCSLSHLVGIDDEGFQNNFFTLRMTDKKLLPEEQQIIDEKENWNFTILESSGMMINHDSMDIIAELDEVCHSK